MALTSTVGAAQDAVADILKARNILTSRGYKVPIDLGWPAKGPQPEHIWVDAGVENWTQSPSVTGQLDVADREETYTLRIRILVAQRDSYRAARDRVLALVAEVEQALRDHFTANATVWEMEFAGAELGEQVDTDGRRVGATLRLATTAYLGAP